MKDIITNITEEGWLTVSAHIPTGCEQASAALASRFDPPPSGRLTMRYCIPEQYTRRKQDMPLWPTNEKEFAGQLVVTIPALKLVGQDL